MKNRSQLRAGILLMFAATAAAHGAITARLPADGADKACADTLLSLTFDADVAPGTTGQVRIYDAADDKLVDTLDLSIPINQQSYTIAGVTFHAYPVLVNGRTATFHPHNGVLAPAKSYYVQIDPGVLTVGGSPFEGLVGKQAWHFSTKPAPTIGERVVVSADGTGDFATLQGALDAIPPQHDGRMSLLLRKGTYQEIVSMVDKKDLTILGEDREGTLLTYPNNEKVQFGQSSSSKRAVINGLRSTGIAIANLTIRSGTPKGTGGGWQAETVIFKNNSQVMLTDVSLYSFQDTLQMSSAGYVANSYIQGDVDFMWGTGPCFFQDCRFLGVTNNDAFVVSRNNATTHGFIYLRCRFETAPGVTGTFLANNQNYPNSEVVLLDCAVSPQMNPAAWRGRGPAVHYWEYNSTSTVDGSPADVSGRAEGSRRLTKEADAETIAQYSDPAFILGGWKPALAPVIAHQPEQKVVDGAAVLAIQAVGIPTPTFQWLKDGTAIPGATQPTFKLPAGAGGSYSVKITNSSGSITSAALTPDR